MNELIKHVRILTCFDCLIRADAQILSTQFSIDNVNKAGSIVNVDRLRWINSRHVRALFAVESLTDKKKLAVLNGVLPMLSSSLKAAGFLMTPADLVDKFGVNYVWRAMDLMKVQ